MKPTQKIAEAFGFDSRSLGLFRWLLGFCLVVDGLNKMSQARELYTDWGIMPRSYWLAEYMNSWKFSFHLASGETWFQVLLMSIGVAASAMFMIGWRWRIAGIVSFLLLCSLQSRNYLILSSADDVLRLGLFWFLFLKGPGDFAVDEPEGTPRIRVKGLAVWALALQLLYIYFFTAIFKIHPVYTDELSGVYYALNVDYFAKPLGLLLRDHLALTKLLTAATLIWEFVGPFLALLPFWWLRLLVALGFQFFHFGLFATMALALFPWVMMVYWVLFYPSELWRIGLFRRLEDGLRFVVRFLASRLPKGGPLWSPTAWSGRGRVALCGLFLALVTAFNVDGLEKPYFPKLPEWTRRVAYTANVNQIWNMFAPYPIRNDGWFIIEGRFKNGVVVDLMTMKPVTMEKPSDIVDMYPSGEWRKFMMNVWDDGDEKILLPFARHLCRRFADVPAPIGSTVSTMKITFMKERTPPLGEAFPPIEPVVLWNHSCF